MASMHSDFFQGQMDRGYSIGLTITGKLGCPNNNNNKYYIGVLITAVKIFVIQVPKLFLDVTV
jgi:hypothetical protein